MSKYELALVVNAKIEDEAREAVVEKAKSYVARYGGTVEADATCPAEVERHVRIMDNVMRYLVVKKEA